MSKALSQVPYAVNEPVRSYEPGSADVKSLIGTYKKMWKEKVEIPMYIGGKEVKTNEKVRIESPQDHQHDLGFYYQGDMSHVDAAIDAALAAKKQWNRLGTKSFYFPESCRFIGRSLQRQTKRCNHDWTGKKCNAG